MKWERPRPIICSLADHGVKVYARHEGIMELKVNQTELKMVKILLVSSPAWKNLLIGRDILRFRGLVNNDI